MNANFEVKYGQITFSINGGTVLAETEKTKIPEKNISIELENLQALQKGHPQTSFSFDQLSSEQKKEILEDLSRRKITIMSDRKTTKIILHALP